MSAKSRKRNKRLLALAGLAGAVAMSNRKPKQSSTEANSGKDGDSASAIARRNANKDTSTKPIAKPDTTPKDTQPKGSNVRTRQRIVDSSGSTVESAGVKSKDVKGILPPSQNKGNMYAGVGDTNPRSRGYGKKDGGRAGYKSGGSTGSSKSSGCAIKGISPILMKGRK